jgi:hypothetical protein
MSRTTTKVLALTAASGLAVMGFLLAEPAFAGTNGQQLQVCQLQGDDYTQMRLQGTNQNGVTTRATFDIAPGGCGSTPGYYWIGEVSVLLADSKTGAPAWAMGRCNVPKAQESGDLYDCFL